MTDRARHRWTWLALSAIVAGSAALRLAGIAHGAPYVYHPDEWVVAKAAMRMLDDGALLPPWYYYPSLLNEVLVPVVRVVHAITDVSLATEPPWGLHGMRQMAWSDALPAQFPYFLAGRALVASLGVATVPVVFAIGRRAGGTALGLISAAILGASVLHVVHSGFLTTDVPLAFLGALVLWASVRFLDERRLRLLVLAGLATGLAASTKYNGAALALVPALAWLIGRPSTSPDPVPLRVAVPGAALAFALAAIVGTPAAVLDPGALLAGVGLQVDAYAVSGLIGNSSGGPPVLGNLGYYLTYLWSIGLGPAIVTLIVVGTIVAIRRRSGSDLLLLVFPVVYLLIASIPIIRFERNLVVMLPFLAVLGGIGAMRLSALLAASLARIDAARSWDRVALAGVVLVSGLATAPLLATAVASNVAADTRTVALEWIAANLRGEGRIVRERYTPQVDQATAPTDFSVDLVAQPLDWYRGKGYRYVIASDYSYARYFAGDYPTQRAGYEAILALPEVHRVVPGAGVSGPTIRIFRLDP